MSQTQQNPFYPGQTPIVFDGFSGLNTNSSRPGIEDQEMSWCDGFFPVGKDQLRTMPGVGPAIYTGALNNVVSYAFGNIAATPIMVLFLRDGSVVQVNTQTAVATTMAGAGTILNPALGSIGVSQWGSQFILMVSQQPNGYFVWDGTTFYVTGMTVPGPSGGVMPAGVSGNAIETYSGRIWIANNATITFAAPGSVIDFATVDGGGSFTSVDSFLRVRYTQLIQTNGFLYLIGDSSINYISGVQTGGSPVTTTFTNQNANPEVGTPWEGTVDVFGENILFANSFGSHVSYGGKASKISEPLDGIYNSVPNFGGFFPSAGKAIVFGKKVWCLLLPVIDAITGQQTNKIFMWQNGKKWWSTQQDFPLIFIQHQEIDSVLTCYGTDGTSVWPLFQQPSTAFTKTVQSKLFATPGGYMFTKTVGRLWGLAIYYSNLSPALKVSVDNETGNSGTAIVGGLATTIINALGDVVPVVNALSVPVVISGSGTGIYVFPPQAVGQQGALTGLTVSTNAADMALVSLTYGPEIQQYNG